MVDLVENKQEQFYCSYVLYSLRSLKTEDQMKTISAMKARENLYKILEEAQKSGEPIQITGKRASAVLISDAP